MIGEKLLNFGITPCSSAAGWGWIGSDREDVSGVEGRPSDDADMRRWEGIIKIMVYCSGGMGWGVVWFDFG